MKLQNPQDYSDTSEALNQEPSETYRNLQETPLGNQASELLKPLRHFG